MYWLYGLNVIMTDKKYVVEILINSEELIAIKLYYNKKRYIISN